MAKFCKMLVTVPVDDHVPVALVYERTRLGLEELGTVTVEIPPQANEPVEGEEPSTPLIPPEQIKATGKVHYPAVSVAQYAERQPKTAPGAPARGKRPATG